MLFKSMVTSTSEAVALEITLLEGLQLNSKLTKAKLSMIYFIMVWINGTISSNDY